VVQWTGQGSEAFFHHAAINFTDLDVSMAPQFQDLADVDPVFQHLRFAAVFGLRFFAVVFDKEK
jgi:hypothetical protein